MRMLHGNIILKKITSYNYNPRIRYIKKVYMYCILLWANYKDPSTAYSIVITLMIKVVQHLLDTKQIFRSLLTYLLLR